MGTVQNIKVKENGGGVRGAFHKTIRDSPGNVSLKIKKKAQLIPKSAVNNLVFFNYLFWTVPIILAKVILFLGFNLHLLCETIKTGHDWKLWIFKRKHLFGISEGRKAAIKAGRLGR